MLPARVAAAVMLTLGAALLAGPPRAVAAGGGGLDVRVNGVPVAVSGLSMTAAQDYTECDSNGTSHTDTLGGYRIADVITAAGSSPAQATGVSVPRIKAAGAVTLTPADYATPDDFAEGPAIVAFRDSQQPQFFRPLRTDESCPANPNGPDYVQPGQGSDLEVDIASGTPLHPTATASDTTPAVGEAVDFTGSDSDAPASETLAYRWTFDDGTVLMQKDVTHAFTGAGTHTVQLTVSDAANPAAAGGAADPLTITVASAPGPTGPASASPSTSATSASPAAGATSPGVGLSARASVRPSAAATSARPSSARPTSARPTARPTSAAPATRPTSPRPSAAPTPARTPSAAVSASGTASTGVTVAPPAVGLQLPSAAVIPTAPAVPSDEPSPQLAPSLTPSASPTPTAPPTSASGVPVSGVLLGGLGAPIADQRDPAGAAPPTALDEATLQRALSPTADVASGAGTRWAPYLAGGALLVCLLVGALIEGRRAS